MRSSALARCLLAICVILLAGSGCARSWPDDLPSPTGWQIRAAPIIDHPVPTDPEDAFLPDGVVYAAYAYSSDWDERPVDDWGSYQWLPSRLDVVCRDSDADLDGVMDVIMVPSNLVVRRWHPKNWSSALMVFTTGDRTSPAVPMVTDPDLLIGGISPFVGGNENVGDAIDGLREYAHLENASVVIRATFKDDSRPPLTISFPLGEASDSHNLQLLVERCGTVW